MSQAETPLGEWSDEFDLIEFIRQQAQAQPAAGVALGIGDDCAVLHPPASGQLLVSSDTLNENVHFLASDPPQAIGHKALAVNLSDLAASGAEPRWVTLNLSLPRLDKRWLHGFLAGFFDLARAHRVSLVGGDTTAGPLSIAVTALGVARQPLLRSAARAGDLVVVSGQIGSAAFALQHRHTAAGWALSRHLQFPQPRLDISAAIAPFAHACIDVSDGLLADLQHICSASQLDAVIELEQLPVNPWVKQHAPDWPALALAGGDDYQLLFTLDENDREHLPADCRLIGRMQAPLARPQARVTRAGQAFPVTPRGYRHFSDSA
jgi:thiamine-monophosphate kinase